MVLGILARDGKGTPANPSQAYIHFRIATLQGGEAVAHLLRSDTDRLHALLPATEAQRLDSDAATWVQLHSLQPDIVHRKTGTTLLLHGPDLNLMYLTQTEPVISR